MYSCCCLVFFALCSFVYQPTQVHMHSLIFLFFFNPVFSVHTRALACTRTSMGERRGYLFVCFLSPAVPISFDRSASDTGGLHPPSCRLFRLRCRFSFLLACRIQLDDRPRGAHVAHLLRVHGSQRGPAQHETREERVQEVRPGVLGSARPAGDPLLHSRHGHGHGAEGKVSRTHCRRLGTRYKEDVNRSAHPERTHGV